MKKLLLIGVAIMVIGVGTIAVARSGRGSKSSDMASQSEPADTVPNQIAIQDFSFKSDKMTVKKGTTVTWTNKDDAHHDITPTGGASDFVASKLMNKGESYAFTFNTVGTYTYKCSPHPYMKGTIEVIE